MKTVAYYRHREGEIREVAQDAGSLWCRVVKHQPDYDGGPVPSQWNTCGYPTTLASLDESWRGAWTRLSLCSRRPRDW